MQRHYFKVPSYKIEPIFKDSHKDKISKYSSRDLTSTDV